MLKVLTPQRGLVSLMAKGAKRPKSPFYGAFDSIHLLELVYRHQEGKELHTLNECSIMQNRAHHQQDLMHGAVATLIREVIMKSLHEGEGSPEMFDLVNKSLDWLDHTREISLFKSYQFIGRFLYKLCEIFGFGIQHTHCINCEHELNPENLHHFDLSEGGFLCQHCQMEFIHVEFPEWLRSLWLLIGNPQALHPQSPQLEVVEEMLFKYLHGHLNQNPKLLTKEYLSQIRKMS